MTGLENRDSNVFDKMSKVVKWQTITNPLERSLVILIGEKAWATKDFKMQIAMLA